MLRLHSSIQRALAAAGSAKSLRRLRLGIWFALATAVWLALINGGPISAQFGGQPGRAIAVGFVAPSDGLDISGTWSQRLFEDWVQRMPGSDLGDYTGFPVNDAARLRADAWDPAIWSLPEWQCRPHGADYRFRADWPLRVWKEVDPVSRDLVAFWVEAFGAVDRPIYMDGRPHPSADAQHRWAGFSTGRWDGNMLTVKTTHIKENYFNRNGVPQSDLATITEHWIRYGDILTIATITTDPVYLTEPLIRTTDYELDLTLQIPPFRCEVVEETARSKGEVPHYLPGSNPYVKEFADRFRLPFQATRGGAETIYPDYQSKLAGVSRETAFAPPDRRHTSLEVVSDSVQGITAVATPSAPVAVGRPITGSARATASVDLTGDWVSIVTEDWRWRMVTPPKGDHSGVPLNDEGRKVADSWDPARDEAVWEQCRAYGAAGIMRMPGRLRITWENDSTVQIDTEAGTQRRTIHFGQAEEPVQPTWQGYSRGEWQYVAADARGSADPSRGGYLKVVTRNMRSGYLRRNGVPHSDQAILTEYFSHAVEDNGDEWLIVTSVVDDPTYLRQRFITSTHFKKIPRGSAWRPTACQSL